MTAGRLVERALDEALQLTSHAYGQADSASISVQPFTARAADGHAASMQSWPHHSPILSSVAQPCRNMVCEY